MADDEADASLARYNANLDTLQHRVIVKFADEITWRVVHRTPVDTGRARGNWVAGVGTPNGDVDENRFDPDGGATCAAAHDVFDKFEPGQPLYLTNGLPYINALEHGHSQKAPNGMIAVTIAEAPLIAREIASEGVDVILHGSGPIEGNIMVMQGGE